MGKISHYLSRNVRRKLSAAALTAAMTVTAVFPAYAEPLSKDREVVWHTLEETGSQEGNWELATDSDAESQEDEWELATDSDAETDVDEGRNEE